MKRLVTWRHCALKENMHSLELLESTFLSILDANIDAHLYDFDVNDDLSITPQSYRPIILWVLNEHLELN